MFLQGPGEYHYQMFSFQAKSVKKLVISIGAPQKVNNEELIAAIARIAISGSAAHDRRRNEVIRSVKTLDQLTEYLQNEGYNLQRSSVYLRLLPRNVRTRKGKRHMTVAPVKLFSELKMINIRTTLQRNLLMPQLCR